MLMLVSNTVVNEGVIMRQINKNNESSKISAKEILTKEFKSAWDWYKWGIPICLFIFICAALYELLKDILT
jgi:hypothetical protein